MSGRKTFVAGDILTASQVNEFLMDQVVQVYPSDAARGSAIPSAIEGAVSYLEDVDKLQLATGTATYVDVYPAVPLAGQIVQVVQDVKLDSFSTSSTSYTNVTGLSVTITPTSALNKVLVMCQFQALTANQESYFRLSGGSAATYIGDAAGSRERAATIPGQTAGGGRPANNSLIYLDSPATTSATTYALQTRTISGGTSYVGRSASDTDNANFGRFPASIIAMEVKA